MKDAIEFLRNEHKALLQVVKTGRLILADEELSADRRLLHDYILLIRNYTENCHFPKEENILYPLLKEKSKDLNKDLLFEICDNHEDFRALMADIENLFEQYDYKRLRMTLLNYLDLLEDHFKKEDSGILSLAPGLLSEKSRAVICDHFVELDEHEGEKEELKKAIEKINLRLQSKTEV